MAIDPTAGSKDIDTGYMFGALIVVVALWVAVS
jgi:hypothetical protein